MYVDQIMTQDVIQVTEDTKITHIAGLMQAKPQHRRGGDACGDCPLSCCGS
jgi:CBS domain-containing protein